MTTLRDRSYATPLALALLLACARAVGEEDISVNDIDQFERLVELPRHTQLLTSRGLPGTELASFTTDGCSGGLSVGWEYLAARIESIQDLHGTTPPWEGCCTSHDRLYHEGPGALADEETSFKARKAADLALQACVLETGRKRTADLSAEYEVSTETVDALYKVIADLMYRAVRIGGVPCSGLPWRWGYGWPACS